MSAEPPPSPPAPPQKRQTPAQQAPLPGWILPAFMIVTLIVGGWFIIDNLSATSKLEDCQMSGRKNCVAPIDTSQMGR